MPRRIESLGLAGPAGRLEALLEEPEDGEPRMAAVVCHPHPLYGGTMHNKVVYRLARGLRRSGIVVLRFNFRGVGAARASTRIWKAKSKTPAPRSPGSANAIPRSPTRSPAFPSARA